MRCLTCTGTAFCLASGGLFARPREIPEAAEAPEFAFKHRTVSINRVRELNDWLERLQKEGRLSSQKTYLKYIGSFEYAAPEAMPDARSIIVLAMPLRIAAVTFRLDGRAHDLLIPAGYVDNGITLEAIQERLAKQVLKAPGSRLERAKLPLKTLAVRSGLAEYGKNNITFVDGYGSFHMLLAYYTNEDLPDNWGPLRLLRLCKGCTICVKACPTRCFSDGEFVINAGRCLSLYNELPAPIPRWISPKVHHSLVGCLRCQYDCPANEEGIRDIEKIADLSEEETRLILNGGEDKALQASLAAKLERFPSVQDFAYFSRNARLAWANAAPA